MQHGDYGSLTITGQVFKTKPTNWILIEDSGKVWQLGNQEYEWEAEDRPERAFGAGQVITSKEHSRKTYTVGPDEEEVYDHFDKCWTTLDVPLTNKYFVEDNNSAPTKFSSSVSGGAIKITTDINPNTGIVTASQINTDRTRNGN